MKAIKENKVYTIDEMEKKRYLEEGYDIYDEDGKIVEYSPKKMIKYSEYDKVLKENAALKAELEELKKSAKKTSKTEKTEE